MAEGAERSRRDGAPPAPIDPRLEGLVRWLDDAFEIPGLGVRFGLDALAGLVPGLGDALSLALSLVILTAAARRGVPRVTLARMALNLGIDAVLGAIPLLGDLFDVAFRANRRNLELLRARLATEPATLRRARAGDWAFVVGLIAALVALAAAAIALTVWLIGAALGALAA